MRYSVRSPVSIQTPLNFVLKHQVTGLNFVLYFFKFYCTLIRFCVDMRAYDFPDFLLFLNFAKCATEMAKCHTILSEKFTED